MKRLGMSRKSLLVRRMTTHAEWLTPSADLQWRQLRARTERYGYTEPVPPSAGLPSLFAGETIPCRELTPIRKVVIEWWMRTAAAATPNPPPRFHVSPPKRVNAQFCYDKWRETEESRTYLGRIDTTGEIFAEATRLFDPTINWEPENRTLLGEVARKQHELRASNLPAETVREIVGELVPYVVHATNALEGSQLTFNETKWWSSIAVSGCFDLSFKRRSSNPNPLPPDHDRLAAAAEVVNASQLYAQLIPNIADGETGASIAASTEPTSALPIRSGSVTEPLLHRVNGSVRGLSEHRAYRDHSVRIGMQPILLAPPKACASLMHRLVNQIQLDEGRTGVSAFAVAASAAYRLARIHPWGDGNGRTARFLSDLLLLRARSVPGVFHLSDKQLYWNALNWADQGDGAPFADLLLARTSDILDVYLKAAALRK